MQRLLCSALLLTAAVLHVHGKVEISFLQQPAGKYLKPHHEARGDLGAVDLTAVVTALLSVAPLVHIDAGTSEQVASIIQASPFDRPEAVAVFSIAGGSSAPSLQQLETAQQLEAGSAKQVLQALDLLAGSDEIGHSLLAAASLPGCGESCLEATLQEAVADLALDANYTWGPASLRGTLALRTTPDAQPIILDLERVPDRLFAIELASIWKTAADVVEDRGRREAQDGTQRQRPQVIEGTMVSLQALLNAYGAGSPQYLAAGSVAQRLMQATVNKLQEGYSGRIVFIIATLDESELPGSNKELATILKLRHPSGSSHPARALLAADNATNDDDSAYLEAFIAWIAMWSTFFLLLFFAIAGCHCLTSMKFKQDSLLYGKNKSD